VNWLTFLCIEFVSLWGPSRRMFDDGEECTGTRYSLFWILVVPASDPKDQFIERVTMFIVTEPPRGGVHHQDQLERFSAKREHNQQT
jgi:hypothetical protein